MNQIKLIKLNVVMRIMFAFHFQLDPENDILCTRQSQASKIKSLKKQKQNGGEL